MVRRGGIRSRVSPWPPRLGAAVTLLVGLVNVASALTPGIRWRHHLLLQVEPLSAMRAFHAMALPLGALLLLVAPYLLLRRRRALQAAIVLMVALGVVNLLKGLDAGESLLGWLTALGLYLARGTFTVEHDPITLRSAVWRVPLLSAAGLTLVTLADWISHGRTRLVRVVRESGALLRFHPGPLRFEQHRVLIARLAWIPLAVHLVEIGTLLGIAYAVFRPLARPRALPAPAVRRLAAELVRAHGRDTLSFFKLRRDKLYFFNETSDAFVGYRVEAGVMLLSGDPVGPVQAFPELLRQVRAFARSRGLRLGAIGVSEALVPLYAELGCRTRYLGDEAVIDLPAFSLEGRSIRKVRQSVHRLQRAGYRAHLCGLGELLPEEIEQLERVIELGRMGAPERGFSMGMDSIRGDREQDTLFVLARDGDGALRGVLHFVPCYGRPAVSLSMMRRDPATPNGLTEFLVCEAVALLRTRGLQEMSLNFATVARYMHSPAGAFERTVGRIAKRLNPYFQIESLYRFNAKFFPRWEPRYIAYEGRCGLPRLFLAAMWAEGQLVKPRLLRIHPGPPARRTEGSRLRRGAASRAGAEAT
jgi:lysyl-tRNA synthetase class 2